jgi:hypothetical protein
MLTLLFSSEPGTMVNNIGGKVEALSSGLDNGLVHIVQRNTRREKVVYG